MNNDKIRRFTAYCLDLLIIVLIATGLFEIKALHPYADKYESVYNEYTEYIKKVNDAGKKTEGIIISYFNDEVSQDDLKKIDDVSDIKLVDKDDISEDEKDSLLKYVLDYFNNNDVTKAYVITITDSSLIEKVTKEVKKIDNIVDVQEYVDETKEEIKPISDMTEKERDEYLEKTGSMLRDIDYYGISYNVCWLVVVILYFTIFPYFNNGMTIGKRIVKLKMVRSDDENKKVSLWQYFIKAILCPIYGTGMLSNALSFIVMIVTPFLFDGSSFAYATTYINIGICVLCYIDAFMIAFKKDSISYTDKLAKVKVADYVRD